jgi:hypothetical protein
MRSDVTFTVAAGKQEEVSVATIIHKQLKWEGGITAAFLAKARILSGVEAQRHSLFEKRSL